jgi:heme exporter protein D
MSKTKKSPYHKTYEVISEEEDSQKSSNGSFSPKKSMFSLESPIKFLSNEQRIKLERTRLYKLIQFAVKKSEDQFSQVQLSGSRGSVAEFIVQIWDDGSLKSYLAWAVWLIIGAIFYANVNFNGDYSIGFYFSVNVGYSIGWGVFHDHSTLCKTYSIFHLLIGALFASRGLASVIESTIHENENAYEKFRKQNRLLQRNPFVKYPSLSNLYVWTAMNSSSLFVICLWIAIVIFGVIWSRESIKWPVIDSFYFSLSSLSTGGLWGIPQDSPSYYFLIVGLFAAFGVPLMAMAMANLAALIVQHRAIGKLLQQQKFGSIQLDENEKLLIDLFQNDHSRKYIDKNEYLLFCLVKKKKVDLALVRSIFEEFESLDANGTGVLTYQDIETRQRNKNSSKETNSRDTDIAKEIELNPLHNSFPPKTSENAEP